RRAITLFHLPRPQRFQAAALILSTFQVSSPLLSIIRGSCSSSSVYPGKRLLPAHFKVSTWKYRYIAISILSSTTYSEITFITIYL
ncbi:hypothetical protein K456DRAFT_1943779, partial [Colletotrichum gloeosporioides 23]